MQTVLIDPLEDCEFCDKCKGGYKCRILGTVRCIDKNAKKVCTFYEEKSAYNARQNAFNGGRGNE